MSGRKDVLTPQHIIVAGDMSQATVTSANMPVMFMDNIGVQVNWSAGSSPVGVIQVQASLDGVNFDALDFGSVINITGNSGSLLININQIPYNQIRVQYIKTSGSGTLDVYMTAKMI